MNDTDDLCVAAELGRCAGVVDGEGCIGVYHSGGTRYRLILSVYNTDPRMILKLQEILGGMIHSRHAKEGCRTMFDWTIRDQQARQVLEILLPFLVVKKEQAMLGMEFCSINKTVRGAGIAVPEAILARRCAVADRLKLLKTIEFPLDSIETGGSWPQTTLK